MPESTTSTKLAVARSPSEPQKSRGALGAGTGKPAPGRRVRVHLQSLQRAAGGAFSHGAIRVEAGTMTGADPFAVGDPVQVAAQVGALRRKRAEGPVSITLNQCGALDGQAFRNLLGNGDDAWHLAGAKQVQHGPQGPQQGQACSAPQQQLSEPMAASG